MLYYLLYVIYDLLYVTCYLSYVMYYVYYILCFYLSYSLYMTIDAPDAYFSVNKMRSLKLSLETLILHCIIAGIYVMCG